MARSEPIFVVLPEIDAAAAGVDRLRRQALRLIQGAADAGDPPRLERPKRDHFSGAPADPAASPAPARALMVGVVTMPAVFLVVVMIALALFGRPAPKVGAAVETAALDRLQQPSARPATSASLSAAGTQAPQFVGIRIEEDARISGISLDGDRVALHVEGPMGQEILIYDYSKDRVISQTPIEAASLEADDSLAMLTGAPPAPSIKPRNAD